MNPVTLLQLEEPRHKPSSGDGFALLRLGFRPFYLLGLLAAASLPLLWIAMLAGAPLRPSMSGPLWHGHEMLFGFAVAVIVGFLFTAGKLWTGLPTPTGGFLGGLALLWLAARIAALAAPPDVYFLLDVAFLPLVAAVFADLVIRSRNVRNVPMAGLLGLLALANLLFHLAHQGVIAVSASSVLRATLALVIAIESIVAGRVIPAFIGNAVPGSRPRVLPLLEKAMLPASAIAFSLWLARPHGPATALALAALAFLHAVRLIAWQPLKARGRPILWILPLAYSWIPLGIALLALAAAGVVAASAGLHALAAGSIGGLVAAMTTRTSRGHTGRPLVAGRAERWAYAAVTAGAILRVATALLPAGVNWMLLTASAALWSAAFLLILATLLPWLVKPRLDGKDG